MSKTNALRREIIEKERDAILDCRRMRKPLSWKILAESYGVSVPTLKRYLNGK